MTNSKCAFCQSNEAEILFEVKDYVLLSADIFKVIKCSSCGLVSTYPRFAPEELNKYYPAAFFEGKPDTVAKILSVFYGRDKVKITEKAGKKGKILDIGCANGGFLELMKGLGWDAYGTDMSSIACNHAKEKLGEEHVFEGDILSLKLNEKFFNVVTMWHVVEHVSDPLNELIKINSLLAAEGVLIINCPNFDSWQRKIFKGFWYPLDVPRHLFHFTPDSLGKIAVKAGFKIRRRKYVSDAAYNLSTFKMSALRLLKFDKMTATGSSTGEERLEKKHLLIILWKLVRLCFNGFCLLSSAIMNIMGSREQILLVCQKEYN